MELGRWKMILGGRVGEKQEITWHFPCLEIRFEIIQTRVHSTKLLLLKNTYG